MKSIKVSKNFFVPKNNHERFAQQVYNLLVENFSDTFFVGGMVRNLFWRKKITDIDIATKATPRQVVRLLKQHGFETNETAKQFGVITVSYNKRPIEIATFRKDTYSRDRYPKVTFTKSVNVDSQRRDFTINSLYFHAKKSFILDPQQGAGDIKHYQLRSIGNPIIKFREDPLRIIRAYRFQKQYQLQFDLETKTALEESLVLVNKLSKARLKFEIDKCASQNIKNFLIKKFL